MTDLPPPLLQVEPLRALAERADHADIKSMKSDVSLRAFIAGMVSYHPWWMRALYAVRWLFVRMLGLRQEGIPRPAPVHPDAVPMTPGADLLFFTVTHAAEEHYWIARATESHLTAYIAAVVAGERSQRTVYVVTLVFYHRWTGTLYFNVIRPFHHIVVRRMLRAGITYEKPRSGAASGGA